MPALCLPAVDRACSAAELIDVLTAEGFEPGLPPSPHAASVLSIDTQVALAMVCPSPACRRRGLLFRPFHRGRAYRAVCECPVCHVGEEM